MGGMAVSLDSGSIMEICQRSGGRGYVACSLACINI